MKMTTKQLEKAAKTALTFQTIETASPMIMIFRCKRAAEYGEMFKQMQEILNSEIQENPTIEQVIQKYLDHAIRLRSV